MVLSPLPGEGDVLPVGPKLCSRQPEGRRHGAPDRDHVARRRCHAGKREHRIVRVQNRGSARAQHLVEQAHLRADIVVMIGVIVHVIARDIGQRRRLQPHPVDAMLCQTVAGRLHRRVGTAFVRQPRQQRVQSHRLRRGHAQRLLEALTLDTRCAECRCGQPQRCPDLPREAGDRGLAVGPRDGHHRFRLLPVERRCNPRQHGPRIACHEKRHRQLPDIGLGDLEARLGADHRRGPLAHGILRERRAIQFQPRHRDEDESLADLAAVDGQAGHLPRRLGRRTGMVQRRQAERLERVGHRVRLPIPIARPALLAPRPAAPGSGAAPGWA